ncbi:hypothetical protein BD289DRAFT_432434 [Coniella lustricola]|uniref:Uncharacterized protein n=1 Tax=Coniella lustricola TaxID=2025994 RepID=A0A2T3A9P6_9PEZI|nr:hypothetical protein BD289DRAFT_432434 [Coniella lustricola]
MTSYIHRIPDVRREWRIEAVGPGSQSGKSLRGCDEQLSVEAPWRRVFLSFCHAERWNSVRMETLSLLFEPSTRGCPAPVKCQSLDRLPTISGLNAASSFFSSFDPISSSPRKGRWREVHLPFSAALFQRNRPKQTVVRLMSHINIVLISTIFLLKNPSETAPRVQYPFHV